MKVHIEYTNIHTVLKYYSHYYYNNSCVELYQR